MAHDEPPHLDLHCLPSGLRILDMIYLGFNIFPKLADKNFVVCFLVVKEFTRFPHKHALFYIFLISVNYVDNSGMIVSIIPP